MEIALTDIIHTEYHAAQDCNFDTYSTRISNYRSFIKLSTNSRQAHLVAIFFLSLRIADTHKGDTIVL